MSSFVFMPSLSATTCGSATKAAIGNFFNLETAFYNAEIGAVRHG